MTQDWVPLPYQLRGAEFLVDEGMRGALLALDPGQRKTSIVYAAFLALKKAKRAKRMLVVAPLRPAQLVWPAEAEKWSQFAKLRVVLLHGDKKDELARSPADVFVINPEGLKWLFGVTKTKKIGSDGAQSKRPTYSFDLSRVKALGCDVLTMDEAHMFKHGNSDRSKIIVPNAELFRYRFGSTGTPEEEGLHDLFGVMRPIDLGRSLGRYITHFRKQFFFETGFQGRELVLKPEAEKQIRQRIAPSTFTISAKEAAKIPALREPPPIEVELPPAARKVYREMERELIVELERGTVTAANAGVATLKCRQIASGALYDERVPGAPRGKRGWTQIHTAKAEAAAEVYEELAGKQLLLLYEFDHEVEPLLAALGESDAEVFGGGMSTAEAKRVEAAWNAGKIRKLLGQPQAVGTGLNLQGSHANQVLWVTPTYRRGLYEQTVRRLQRSGNASRAVFSRVLVARGTFDEAAQSARLSKQEGSAAFMRALRDYASRAKAR
jgi:SNF2 family DNA or RNA helicase